MLDLYDGVRLIVIAEAVIVVIAVLFQVQFSGGWTRMDAINRFRLSGVGLLAAANGYGAVEAILDNTRGNLRIIFISIALGYVVWAYSVIAHQLYCQRRKDRLCNDGSVD